MRTGLRLFALICIGIVLQGCGIAQNRAIGTKTAVAEHIAGMPLNIETLNGSVEVRADSSIGDVQVTAKVCCSGQTQAEADQRLSQAEISIARNPDRVLTIKPVFPGGSRGNDGASLVVRVPSADGATIATSNGAIRVAGLAGVLTVKTSNGSVNVVDHTGATRIHTSNGGVEVQNLSGDLHVDTSNGTVQVANLAGAADIKSSNGGIRVALAPDHSSPLDLRTSNGGIRATVGRAFAGTVKLDTSNARVRIEDPAGRIRSSEVGSHAGSVVIGDGGAGSTLETSNGTVELVIAQ